MKEITRKKLFPLNLQFFAEPEPSNEPEPNNESEPSNEPEPNAPTLESLAAELASIKAENAKLKASNDKLCQSEGTLRKQLRAKMTAEEEAKAAEEEAKNAAAEHTAAVEKELAILKSSARYVRMGFDPETATATATADYEGDRETVDANIEKLLASQKKKMEAEIREEYLKNLPNPQAGNNTTVDYSKQISDAIVAGDNLAAISAILLQSQQNSK